MSSYVLGFSWKIWLNWTTSLLGTSCWRDRSVFLGWPWSHLPLIGGSMGGRKAVGDPQLLRPQACSYHLPSEPHPLPTWPLFQHWPWTHTSRWWTPGKCNGSGHTGKIPRAVCLLSGEKAWLAKSLVLFCDFLLKSLWQATNSGRNRGLWNACTWKGVDKTSEMQEFRKKS